MVWSSCAWLGVLMERLIVFSSGFPTSILTEGWFRCSYQAVWLPCRFSPYISFKSQKSTKRHNVRCLIEECGSDVPQSFPWQGALLFPNTRWPPLIGCRPLVQRRGSSPSCTSSEHARKYVVGFKRDGRQPKVQRTFDSSMM